VATLHDPRIGPNLLSIYDITHTNKKVEFWPNQWVIKDINDDFKVIASGYCDESDHKYKLGKSSSPSKQSGFSTMVANTNDTSKLWHQCLGHTNFGTLHYMSHLRMADGLPLIQPPSGVCEGCMLGRTSS
jgi:hypothetical protein